MFQASDPGHYTHKSRHAVMNKNDAEIFKDYYKIAVVRNSYELCASFYRFMTEKIINERQKPSSIKELIESQIVATEHSQPWQIRESKNPFPIQLDYISEHDKILVNEIFIFDNDLDSVLSKVKRKFNFKEKFVKTEGSHYYGSYDWRKYYDDESIEYVEKICQKDIQYFNFKFN
jgi:hypothetical protein